MSADALARVLPSGTRFAPAVAAWMLLHVLAGVASVVTGALAALSPKARGRHTRLGSVYLWSTVVL